MDEASGYRYFEDVNLGLLRLWRGRRGLRVLDVGCGFATTSGEIQRLGNEVTGIESNAGACEVAATRISRVIAADLQEADLPEREIGLDRFDVVILADVLEHLASPLPVLRRYVGVLAPGGSVLLSLPNVALWSVRFGLLFGRWEYADTGVLDRTHLRFFTRRGARRLLHDAGLTPVASTINPGLARPFVPLVKRLAGGKGGVHDPAAILNSPAYRFYARAIHPVERAVASLWPGMLAFQMLFEAKRNG